MYVLGNRYLLRSCRPFFPPFLQLTNDFKLCSCLSNTVTTSINSDAMTIKPFSEIPPKGFLKNLPYVGILFQINIFGKDRPNWKNSTELMQRLQKKHGDVFKVRSKDGFIVFIGDADDARKVFQANYVEHKRLKMDLSKVMAERSKRTKTIDLLDGKEWERRRKPAQEKMLRPAIVASYVPLIEKVTNDFVEHIRKRQNIDDLMEELLNYSTESIGMLCFNKRLGCIESDTVHPAISAVREMFEMFQQSFRDFSYRNPKSKFSERFEEIGKTFADETDKELYSQKAFLKKLEEEGKLEDYLQTEPNFMYSLLSDPRVSDDEARTMIGSLFGAGIETTANGMAFLLIDLALNTDKQQTLFEEITRVVSNSDTLTKEHLAQMSYLKACVRESHRKTFPTQFGVARILETDLVLSGYQIPKDTIVLINMEAMSLDERYYPRPNEFIPERWLRDTTGELAKGREYPFATKPFGFGPRGCIGQRFAENEIFIGITKIIQSFEISMPSDATEVKKTVKLFRTPGEKVKMHFKDRQKM